MSDEYRPDELADAILKTLRQYGGQAIQVIEESAGRAATTAVRHLRETSPRNEKGVHPGEYARSWTKTVSPGLPINARGRTIYVRPPHYRLQHLLEYGHDIKRKGVIVGESPAKPHIEAAAQLAVQEFEENLRKGLKDAT